MLDHVGFAVRDFAVAKAFYEAALAPLSIQLLVEIPAGVADGGAHAGFGAEGRPTFWIGEGKVASAHIHVAFTAAGRAQVIAFYAAALAAGGTDKGAPGLRPHYHPAYFGAFVLDPNGNNIEAVCRAPA